MKRPQLISPGSLNRMLQEAKEAWEWGDFQQSIELLGRANRLAPANAQILSQLARNHGMRYQFAEAESYFEKAVRVAPDKVEILTAAGSLATEMGNYPMADRFLKRALEHPKLAPGLAARLAEMCERLHRTEEAADLAEHALRMDSACVPARLTQARLHRQAGRLSEAEQVLRPALMAANPEWRIRSYYEMGAICDRQGRYDDAMSAVLEAKTLLRSFVSPSLAQDSNSLFRSLKETQSNISAAILERWYNSAGELLHPPRRLALLAGHARSGTTLLGQMLDAHPNILSADETEIFKQDAYSLLQQGQQHVMNMSESLSMWNQQNLTGGTNLLARLDAASAQTLRQARERYFQTMSRCVGRPLEQCLLIDKNPNLQSLVPAYVRFFPDARLIVALRDPRDVCLSCFMLCYFPLNAMTCAYLSLGVTAAAYSRVMGLWRILAPLLKNPWLEVRYDGMVEDPEPVARKTLDFLGMPWDARVLGFTEHARKKVVRSPTYADVAQPVYKRAQGRWRHYQKYLEPHLSVLEPFVKAFGYE
jgi:tetratricopeptide (TPR) repeat protein